MDVSGCVSKEYREAVEQTRIAGMAAQRIGVGSTKTHRRKVLEGIIKRDRLEGSLGRAGLMFMRARLTGGSLYMITSDTTLTFEQINNLLNYYAKTGLLRHMLDQYRVM